MGQDRSIRRMDILNGLKYEEKSWCLEQKCSIGSSSIHIWKIIWTKERRLL